MTQSHLQTSPNLDQTLAAPLRGFESDSGLMISGLRKIVAAVLRFWLCIYHRLSIVGRENLPLDRSFVLIANHASHLDTLCLLASLPFSRLQQTYPVAAKDYFCSSALRAFAARVVVNALPFDRRCAPLDSLQACSDLLDSPGNILILFPEGTRTADEDPDEFKPGVVHLAAGREIPVVPCHLAGTNAALPKGSWFPWPRSVRLTIGEPRLYSDIPAQNSKEWVRQTCGELREAVIALGGKEPAA